MFLNKWRGIADRNISPQLLESGFPAYILKQSMALADDTFQNTSKEWMAELEKYSHLSPEIVALLKLIKFQKRKLELYSGEKHD